jgi:CBS domain-containing protein
MNYLLESLRLIVQTLALLMLKEISDSFRYTDQQSEIQFFQTLSYNTAPLKIVTDSTVRSSSINVDCITSALICEQNLPIGIVTDTDMRSKLQQDDS